MTSRITATRNRIAAALEGEKTPIGSGAPSAAALLESGRFYAARSLYELRGEPIPAALFQRVGRAFIAEGLFAEGCAAFEVVGSHAPRSVFIAAGDAFLAAYNIEMAIRAYVEAGATRKLAKVGLTLMDRGSFFAARAVFERAGLPVPVRRFRRAATTRRRAGDVAGAAAAEAAISNAHQPPTTP